MFQPRTVGLLLVLITSVVPPTLARAQGTFVYSWAVVGKTIAAGWCDEFHGQSGETASEASVRKLANVLNAFTGCRDAQNCPVEGAQRFTLDDRGVATLSYRYMGEPRSFTMAIANMDLLHDEW